MKDLSLEHASCLILLTILSSVNAFAQGDVIRYDSGFTWRAYTGTTAPVCSGKLCHSYPIYSWDSYYKEFTAWKSLNGDANSARAFVNFRVLFPPGYSVSNKTKKYPLVIMMHGAGESGRVWTGHFNYETTDPMYDNNSHQLRYGANEHRSAAAKPVTDPGSCQAIVVFPQASYSATWSDLSKPDISESEEMLLGFIKDRLIAVYNADPNRIVMHGLSNGAREIWALATKRPDLFAGLMIMSAVPANYTATADTLLTTPIRIFQGGMDTNPTPGATQGLMDVFHSKGGAPQLTVYPQVDHETWFNAYKEPDFFSWIMAQDKRKIYVFGGSTELCNDPIRMGISAGMKKYQWLRNGVEFPGVTERYITVSSPGSYSVRFQRPDNEWVESLPVQLTLKSGCLITAVDHEERNSMVYPNPTAGMITVVAGSEVAPGDVSVISMTGQKVNVPVEVIDRVTLNADLGAVPSGVYIIRITTSGQTFRVVRN